MSAKSSVFWMFFWGKRNTRSGHEYFWLPKQQGDFQPFLKPDPERSIWGGFQSRLRRSMRFGGLGSASTWEKGPVPVIHRAPSVNINFSFCHLSFTEGYPCHEFPKSMISEMYEALCNLALLQFYDDGLNLSIKHHTGYSIGFVVMATPFYPKPRRIVIVIE